MDREYAKYLLEKTRQDYNTIAGHFSKTRKYPWGELVFLAQYSFSGEKVLDLGCGNGRLLEIFRDKNMDYIGVDNSEKLIELAKKRYPKERFLRADALNLPFPANYFDKIYSIAVLHHIPSKEFRLQFLKEARRVLKPEGLLIITVWNLWQWYNWKLLLKFTILKILGKSTLQQVQGCPELRRRAKLDFKDVFVSWDKTYQRYVHNFSQKELKKLVRETRFKVKDIGFFSRGRIKKANIYLVAEKACLERAK